MTNTKTAIGLFTYNRPEHTRLALEALARCERLGECDLYVYCDGPRSPVDQPQVEASRQVVSTWAGRLGARVIDRATNLGLAHSIVTGVTDLCEKYGRAIVVEDDLVVSPDFIDYMLQALDRYENETRVYQISGYMFPVRQPARPDAFFLPMTTTWGWATWQRAWSIFDWTAAGAMEQLADPKRRQRFDLDGSYPYAAMLEDRLAGKNQSWGILWWWAVFSVGGLALHPRRSLVWVGGFDGTGTHCGNITAPQQITLDQIKQPAFQRPLIFPQAVISDEVAFDSIKHYLFDWPIAARQPAENTKRTIKRLTKSLVSSLGYEITRKHSIASSVTPQSELPFGGYDLEQEARENIKIIRLHTMVTYPRLVTLYQQVAFCEKHNIPGSFVECGTWRGGCVGLMALGNLKYGMVRRHIHLFDSFVGIPEPDIAIDGARAVQEVLSVGGEAKGRLMPVSGLYEKFAGGVGDLESNRSLLETVIHYDPSFLHYHQGWFQDTLPNIAREIGGIAILRLDGDWYASTKVCLDYLYDKVVRGGIVIVDDYGHYEGCRKAVDEFMARERVQAYLNHIDYTGRYWIKP